MEKKDIFLRNIEEMLGQPVGSFVGSVPLANMPIWDSMAIIGVIALADGEYNISVQPEDFASAKTLDDIFDVLLKK